MRPLLLWGILWLSGCEEEQEAPHCAGSEQYRVRTEDGAEVVLHRHPASGTPVLVVHGISSNHHCWDLSADRSLAVDLAEHGMDAWLLDLRGHGDARRDSAGGKQNSGWTIDDYALYDLPAAVDKVLAETGAEQLAFVGHSLGGLVGSIYAATVPGADERLSAFVAVGSPMDFSDPDLVMGASLGLGSLASIVLRNLPSQWVAGLQARLPGTYLPLDDLLFRDLSPDVRELMYQRVASPMTRGELRQLSRAPEHGALTDREGGVNYIDAISQVQTPALVIAGRGDQIAPVDRVLATYEALGSPEKRFVIAGRSTGFSADYGHVDITLGDHVREELFPLIRDWVDR